MEEHELLFKLLNLLDTLVDERKRGVPKTNDDKNILPKEEEKKTKGRSVLLPAERKRLKETFNLFNQMFFAYKKKMEEDTHQETLISQINRSQQQQKAPEKEKKSNGLMSMILAGLGLLAGSIAAIVAGAAGFFGDLGGSVAKIFGKLGMVGALKLMGKGILKVFTKGFLKKLPIIGGIIGIAYAVEAFLNNEPWRGVMELASGLLNFIPGIGPFLSLGVDVLIAWLQGKGAFEEGGMFSAENGWNTIKGWMGQIGKFLVDNALYLPIIGTFKRFGMAGDAFGSGDFGEGLKQIGLGILTFFPGGGWLIKGIEILSGWLNSPKEDEAKLTPDSSWMDRMKDWLKSKLDDLPWVLREPLKWFGIIKDDDKNNAAVQAGQAAKDASKGVVGYVTGIWDSVKEPMKEAAGKVSEFTKEAWVKTKEFSKKAFEKTKEAGKWFGEKMEDMSTDVKDKFDKWSPSVVEFGKDAAQKSQNYVEALSSKLSDWFSGFSLQDKKQEMKDTIDSGKQALVEQGEKLATGVLDKTNKLQHYLSHVLSKALIEQIKLLNSLVELNANSLKELRRISGNNSGSNINVYHSGIPNEKSFIPISNNRDGYLTSPYALG